MGYEIVKLMFYKECHYCGDNERLGVIDSDTNNFFCTAHCWRQHNEDMDELVRWTNRLEENKVDTEPQEDPQWSNKERAIARLTFSVKAMKLECGGYRDRIEALENKVDRLYNLLMDGDKE